MTTYNDFDDTNGYDKVTLERETPHGIFRAVVERDEYPDAPHFAYGCPLVSIDYSHGGYRVETIGYGDESAENDGLSMSLADAIQRTYSGARFYEWRHHGGLDYGNERSMDEALEIVDRWLKTFHGGSLVTFTSNVHQGGPTYVAYDTRAMRESWGQEGDQLETSAPDGGEWQAYIDGEVYVVSVEKACSFDDDGEPDDWNVLEGPIGGYYGDDHAAASALEMMGWEIEREAGDMLPLD